MPRVFLKWSDPDIVLRKREEQEKIRKKEGRPHEIFYFHELLDPYSHITAQLINKFTSEYSVELVPMVVNEPPSKTVHEPSLYRKYCLTDATRIAPFYGVEFPSDKLPNAQVVSLAQRILCGLERDEFISRIAEISALVWSGNELALEALMTEKTMSEETTHATISSNEQKRDEVEAYMGSTFSYEGELYWGVDRLDHLEHRLKDLGLKRNVDTNYVSERKKTNTSDIPNHSNIELEFYPSLNSPYTSISLERVKLLQSNYPIKIITKPVLPMLMRNMTIPRYKARYIFRDTAREAKKYDVPFGKVISPLGKPAERAYSLFPWIDQQGQGFEYICRLMISSFRKAEDIGVNSYLKVLIEDLGLDWKEAQKHLDTDIWKDILEKNRLIMYEGDSWGVPTFRLVDGDKTFTTWGQDRIWLIEEEIIKRLNK
jgi:2-hydroxychromene-2-carboxylate isomerase